MKGLFFIVAAVLLILGAYLLIDSAQMTRHVFPFLLDLKSPPLLTGNEIPALLIFTESIHEALLGVGALLVALFFVIGGFGLTWLEGQTTRHQELLAAIRTNKTGS